MMASMAVASDLASLDSSRPHWVPAVSAPVRDWPGAPGCRRGARFLIDGQTLRPTRDGCPTFGTRAECLRWIMANRAALARNAPDARIVPVELAKWLLGMS